MIYLMPIVFIISVILAILAFRKKSLIIAMLACNFFVMPLSLFIATMAYGGPSSSLKNFWSGFFFIQTLPLLALFATIIVVRKRRTVE